MNNSQLENEQFIDGSNRIVIDMNEIINQKKEEMNKKGFTCVEFDGYKIIKYIKDGMNLSNYYENGKGKGFYRSIITKKGILMCYSPQKSRKYDTKWKSENPDMSKLKITEFVEGTMINVFYDAEKLEWQIATRSRINGNGHFYKTEENKTFREMFLEAMISTGMKWDMLNKNYCYSFVLQHPENRIVLKHQKPSLVLTNIYLILLSQEKQYKQIIKNVDIYGELGETIVGQSEVRRPRDFSLPEFNYRDYEKFYGKDQDYTCMGVVFTNEKGERTKIRNENYEKVRELRGNNPKLQYQFYCLRKDRRVGEYLRFYPQDKEKFDIYETQVRTFTHELFKHYINTYVLSKNKSSNIERNENGYYIDYNNPKFKVHSYELHNIYKNGKINYPNFAINMYKVINYVNNLEPAKLMYSINYDLRMQNLKDIKDSYEMVEG
jgi:hypothetical protein